MLRMVKSGNLKTNLKINILRHYKKKLEKMDGSFTAAPLDRKIRILERSMKESGGRLGNR